MNVELVVAIPKLEFVALAIDEESRDARGPWPSVAEDQSFVAPFSRETLNSESLGPSS